MRQSLAILSVLGLSLVAACESSDDSSNTGTGLRSVVLGAGVDGFDYTVTAVDCGTGVVGTVVATAHVDLREGQTLPGNLATFINKPFAKGSEHDFADKFFTLAAGCYDVEVVPYGEGAASCSKAQAKKLQVNEGVTTEMLLISQCVGVDKGALDVIAALNHDPVIDNVYFPESKFTCGAPAEICVAASDPDSDPLRVEITFADGTPCSAGDLAVTDHGLCSVLTCTQPGSYVPQIAVYDQAFNGLNELVDIEDLLADFGGAADLTSHANLNAQIHIDGVVLYKDGDGDTFGGEAKLFCTAPQDGYVAVGGDCNDSDAEQFPGNAEVCDYTSHDENCDDQPAAQPTVVGYNDGDDDGHGAGDARYYCSEDDRVAAGDVTTSNDCNDADASAYPGAEEICGDGIDQDCDGIDPACTTVYWAEGWAVNYATGSLTATIDLPHGDDVTVTFNGQYASFQTGADGEENFWVSPDGAYTSATVDNGVDTTAMIHLSRLLDNQTRSITFSRTVEKPVFAVVSLGNQLGAEATYDFETNFDILSSGTGYYGGGPFKEKAGDKVEGKQGNGVLGFTSNLQTITWKTPANLDVLIFGQGINVGIRR